MFSELGISAQDWGQTPQVVQTVVVSLQHQLRLLQIRHTGYDLHLAAMNEKLVQLDDLKAELAELRERVNQNSRNSNRGSVEACRKQRHHDQNIPEGESHD